MTGATVQLIGGPYDGQSVHKPSSRSLLIDGDGVPEGMVARYRQTRDPLVYRFSHLDRIVTRIQMPGEAS